MKRKRFVPGTFLKIPLTDGTHTYCRLLKFPFIEVYDLKTIEEPKDLGKLMNRNVLFTVFVHNSAITKSNWEIIGKLPYDENAARLPLQFWQNGNNPRECFLMDEFDNKIPATIEQCRGLERVACWDANHVEERILDHFEGRSSQIVEHLRVKEFLE